MFGETRFGNTGRGEGHTGAAASLALDRGHQPSLHCVIGGGELGPVQANLSKKPLRLSISLEAPEAGVVSEACVRGHKLILRQIGELVDLIIPGLLSFGEGLICFLDNDFIGLERRFSLGLLNGILNVLVTKEVLKLLQTKVRMIIKV